MSSAWKDLERRICRALGGRRGHADGMSHSDCVNVPFSVEVKRSSRPGPPVLAKWVLQAKAQGKTERRPWLLVVAGHNDRHPIAVLDFWAFAQLAQEASRIPTPISVESPPCPEDAPHQDQDPAVPQAPKVSDASSPASSPIRVLASIPSTPPNEHGQR